MKIKEQRNKQQDKDIELADLSFQEWLNYFSKELEDMEKKSKIKSINNPYYQPLQGA
ncbi:MULTISPECIES: hypothetical protein [Malaciobacter]|uniref:hypothetical protein n=1 Tax=Malaciobacter TaxID=2321114 RepID=UPI0013FDC423|nr:MULTISPECIES: hypothetical protein [Malaciobacter]QEE31665.1 hypothetical protein ACAN_0129 [Malaciobacter canalis]